MRAYQGGRLLGLFVAAACLLATGCGSSTNNDQGVVFTFLGFFQTDDLDSTGCGGELPTGLSGIRVPLSAAQVESLGTASDVLGGVGFSNSLINQTMRTQTMFYDFEIPGATRQPPSTALPLSLLLGPFVSEDAGDDEEGGTPDESSLPGAFNTVCNQAFAEFIVVPASVLEWINLNRADLPEAPFTMIVTASATGLTSAGDRLDSNDSTLFVEFTPDNFIPPTAAESSGSEGGSEEDFGG